MNETALDPAEAHSIATTTFSQLGGNKFKVMVGATNIFSAPDGTLALDFEMCEEANHLQVKYNFGTDLYTMTFFSADGNEAKKYEGVYCDMLQELFTEFTGLNTYL
jgi:hypothetical protein